MSAFRDSTASLARRIDQLERANARLRRRDHLRFRDRVAGAIRAIVQLLAIVALAAVAMLVATLVAGVLCLAFGAGVAHV